MKVLIVSDIHGHYFNMKKVLDDNPSFDYLFLLGDVLNGPSYMQGYDPEELTLLLNKISRKIFYVQGNCDRYSMEELDCFDERDFLTIPVDKKYFFITHGHRYSRNYLPDELPFDVFIQGHTHIPMMERVRDKIFLNPGSISLPRGGSDASYIFYEDGVFTLKSVEKNRIIKKIEL